MAIYISKSDQFSAFSSSSVYVQIGILVGYLCGLSLGRSVCGLSGSSLGRSVSRSSLSPCLSVWIEEEEARVKQIGSKKNGS